MVVRRARAWVLVLVLGAVLMFVSGVLVVTSRNILDSTRFAANLSAALGDERVASYVAGHVTDAIIVQKPNLLSIRPLLLSSVRAIVISEPFRATVRTSARSAHRFFFQEAGSRLVLSLPDMGTVVRSALEQASPELAAKIPPGIEAKLATGEAERAISTFIRLWTFGERLLIIAWGAWYAGLVLIILAIALAPDRRRGLAESGIALITVGVAFFALVPVSRLIIGAALRDPAVAGFVQGIVAAFLGRLSLAALLVGVPGLVLLSAGTSYLERINPLAVGHRLVDLAATPPATPPARLAWSLALLAAGAVAILWPVQLVTGLVAVLGVGLLYGGLHEVFRLVIGQLPVLVPADSPSGGRRWPIAAGAAVVIFGLGGIGAWLLHSGRGEPPPPVATAFCNGSARLCDRTVDGVVFAAAHNAMSNTSRPDWMFPHHQRGMTQMLDDGVRGLLIDIHYGIPTGGRVKTDLDAEVGSRDKITAALGEEGVAAAMRIRDRLVGGAHEARGLYFCHGFCELGAYPVVPALAEIKDWMVAHPGEVVVAVIEDYVQPAELDNAFRAAGLFRFVYSGSVTTWPTLRELIDSGQRLIVLLESGRPGVTYLRPAFATIAETPYTFRKPEDFSCRPNRGGETGSLFQINHWIETTPAPRPSNAAIVNAYDFLLNRARTCQRERRHLPNIIAVDFAGIGDLVRVANTLNGLDPGAVAGGSR